MIPNAPSQTHLVLLMTAEGAAAHDNNAEELKQNPLTGCRASSVLTAPSL